EEAKGTLPFKYGEGKRPLRYRDPGRISATTKLPTPGSYSTPGLSTMKSAFVLPTAAMVESKQSWYVISSMCSGAISLSTDNALIVKRARGDTPTRRRASARSDGRGGSLMRFPFTHTS